jgi:hypothetical protein
MRIASSTRVRNISPSPIFPVRAVLAMACTASSTQFSGLVFFAPVRSNLTHQLIAELTCSKIWLADYESGSINP